MLYLERKQQMKDARHSALTAEYQVCSTRADFHTNLIWTWGTALVGLNATGIGALAQADKYSDRRFLLVVILAAAGSFLVWWWNLAANSWHVFIKVSYVRLREIERELGMKHNTYINLHDKREPDPADFELWEKLRIETKYPRVGAIRLNALRRYMNFGVPIAWFLVICAEAISHVTRGGPCSTWWNSKCIPLSCGEWTAVGMLAICGLLTLGLVYAALWIFERREKGRICNIA